MSRAAKLALIEDDADQRAALTSWLSLEGYDVWSAPSAEAFYKQFSVQPVDMVIVDLGLPGEDGFETIRYLRQHTHLGIIVLSARSGIDDKINAIELGADNYLVKPVVHKELILYIEALWRRMQSIPSAHQPDDTEMWLLSVESQTLTSPDGVCINLTTSEFLIVDFLVRSDAIVSKNELILALGGSEEYSMHRLDVHLSRLRSKLKKSGASNFSIVTLPNARLQLRSLVEREA